MTKEEKFKNKSIKKIQKITARIRKIAVKILRVVEILKKMIRKIPGIVARQR